jgi:hypothetical protein
VELRSCVFSGTLPPDSAGAPYIALTRIEEGELGDSAKFLEEEWFMKLKDICFLIASVFVLALVFTVGSPAAPNGKSVPPAATRAESAQPAAAAREPHPEIREAIASLRRAKEHMEHAAHDFGGIAWKPFVQPMAPFTNWKSACATTRTS